mgnify:CR=1 FL=1
MAITPQVGFKIDPANPNQVIRDTSISSASLSPSTPLNVQAPTPAPTPNIANVPVTTPSGATVDAKGNITPPPAIAPASDLTSRLEDLQTKLFGKPSAEATAVNQATGGLYSSLNELNTQIKIHQANALAKQEEALKSGETLRYSTGLAGQVARTDAIEAMKLSALAQGMQGNILLAEKQAKNAVEAEFGQTIKDIQTARQNILNNYDTFTSAEKKRADATLLALNEKDAFVERGKADREQSYKTAVEAAKNGLTDTKLLTQIQNSTPDKALELASPYLKEKEKPIIKEFEVGGRLKRQVLDPMTGKVISETDLGAKEEIGFDISTIKEPITKNLFNVANLVGGFSSVNAQKMFATGIKELANNNNKIGIAEKIIGQSLSNIADADTRKRTTGGFNISLQLTVLGELLDQYKTNNGDTGLLVGNIQKAKEKFGQIGDKNLANIGVQILNTLDILARSRTGAVITKDEEKLYNRMLPGIDKVGELNETLINGLKKSLMADVENQLRFNITQDGLTAVKNQLPDVFGEITKKISSEAVDVFDEVISKPTGYFSKLWNSLLGK